MRFTAAEQGRGSAGLDRGCTALEASLAEAVRYQPLIELLDQPRPAAPHRGVRRPRQHDRPSSACTDVTPYGRHGVAARLD